MELLEDRLVPATLTVNSMADDLIPGDGLVTLRGAINAANIDRTTDLGETRDGADTIFFDPVLFASDNTFGPSALFVNSDITILGPTGENGLTIERNDSMANLRLFRVTSGGTLRLDNLALQNGVAQGVPGGSNARGGGGGAPDWVGLSSIKMN